eukprot:scaffold602_cov121-Isochrysis_galbana.AAC.2
MAALLAILAWDLGRLKNEAGVVSRSDKVAYVTMLRGSADSRLGGSDEVANLVGLLLDKVAATCKVVAPVTPDGSDAGPKGGGAEEVAERKKANELYEAFSRQPDHRPAARSEPTRSTRRRLLPELQGASPAGRLHLVHQRVHVACEEEAQAAAQPRLRL